MRALLSRDAAALTPWGRRGAGDHHADFAPARRSTCGAGARPDERARARDEADHLVPDALRHILRRSEGRRVLSSPNREPYLRPRRKDTVIGSAPFDCPVRALRLSSRYAGTWIATRRTADRDTATGKTRQGASRSPGVPHPRVWLSTRREQATTSASPTKAVLFCHLAHNQPIFRAPDGSTTSREPALRHFLRAEAHRDPISWCRLPTSHC